VGKDSPGGDSPCGAADMAGNVWEWCSSQYKDYRYKAGDGRENLTEHVHRALRGGSFHYEASLARCAARYWYVPYARSARALRVSGGVGGPFLWPLITLCSGTLDVWSLGESPERGRAPSLARAFLG